MSLAIIDNRFRIVTDTKVINQTVLGDQLYKWSLAQTGQIYELVHTFGE